MAGVRRLTTDLQELAAQGPAPTLAQFLDQTGREVEEVYKAGGWTTLKRRAGVITLPAEEANDIEDLSDRLGGLCHTDEPVRLRVYRDAVLATAAGTSVPLNAMDRRRIQMLDNQLEHRGEMRVAEATLEYIASRAPIVRELEELREVLDERVSVATAVMPVADWPLALHHHYSRREIAAAVGYVEPGEKRKVPQAGILKLEDTRRELLFVTLDKSGRSFSPTTRYDDYALSPDAFRWETQGAASVTRPSGRRYLDSATNGWTFYLFVRTDPQATYAFLGPVRYDGHTGNRPIAITWKLPYAMPAALFALFATLRS